jgi:OTU domain-containing protein 6
MRLFGGVPHAFYYLLSCIQSISLEADFDKRQREMIERHEVELRELMTAEEEGVDTADDAAAAAALSESVGPTNKEAIDDDELASGAPPPNKDDHDAELERQRRIEKARKKKDKAREKERERERQIADELANAGPSARDLENEVILNQLRPLNLRIREVPADGHCLYRAVAAHYDGAGYGEMRT